MRETHKHLDKYRKTHPTMGSSEPGASYGYFRMRVDGAVLDVISSGKRHALDGLSAWEHVSVSIFPHAKRLPTWKEMCAVKNLFWAPDETVVQFHPPETEYVSIAEVLHLWKPPYNLSLPPTLALAPLVTGSSF